MIETYYQHRVDVPVLGHVTNIRPPIVLSGYIVDDWYIHHIIQKIRKCGHFRFLLTVMTYSVRIVFKKKHSRLNCTCEHSFYKKENHFKL